jgi:HlyD family secretion protein
MAASSEEIFRKVALDRLSSPEQLDQLITLSSPIDWAAVLVLAGLLSAIVAWGIFGSVPTRVDGGGILVARGGQVVDAMAPAGGQLTSVVAVGTAVAKGDVVATLDNTEGDQDLAHARTVLHEQEQQLAELVERLDRGIAVRQQADAQQRASLNGAISGAKQRKAFYGAQLANEEALEAKGFLTRRFVQGTRQQVEDAEQAERQAQNGLMRVNAEELDQRGKRDQVVWTQQQAVNSARRTLEELTIRTGRSTRVVSPAAGHVTEVKATAGSVVAPGKSILSIESAGEGLEMMLYIPPDQGKKVAPGMEVQVAPTTIRKEEFGTLVGHVVDISDFPISPEGMLAALQNPQLAQRFSAQGAPYAARVALMPDPGSPSGYRWAAGKGPLVKLSGGTVAEAEVTVHSQAPITLVLPLFRKNLGI